MDASVRLPTLLRSVAAIGVDFVDAALAMNLLPLGLDQDVRGVHSSPFSLGQSGWARCSVLVTEFTANVEFRPISCRSDGSPNRFGCETIAIGQAAALQLQ